MPRAAEPFGVLVDRAVYLPDAATLVAADLHLGMAAASAVDAPLDGGPAVVDRLGALVDRFGPDEVVLAGDVLHAFDAVPRAARTAWDALVDRVRAGGASLVPIEGNHDPQLAALSSLEPAAFHRLADGTVVCHGHERPAATGPRYVIGHDHPAIDIEGRRRPCYLRGAAEDGADVLVLPAFNAALGGTAVNGLSDGDALSPFLAAVTRFNPVVTDPDAGDPLEFPPLASLQPYL